MRQRVGYGRLGGNRSERYGGNGKSENAPEYPWQQTRHHCSSPTGNLHSAQSREIMQLFSRLNAQGTTIIQVTHSEDNAAYGQRVIRLQDGFLV